MTAPTSGILGDPDTAPVLSPADAKALRNASLVKAGLAVASGTQGLFPSLLGGMDVGQQNYQQGVQQAVQGQELQMQRMMQRVMMAQQMRVQQTRAAVLQKFPMPDPNDPEAVRKYSAQVLPYYLAAGDKDMVDAITKIRNIVPASDQPPTNQKVTNISGADPGLRAAFPGLKLDPSKAYTVNVDRSGKYVGQPMEEAPPPKLVPDPNAPETLSQKLQIDNAFGRDIAPLKERGLEIQRANAALDEVMKGNRAALGSAFSNFVQAVDQDKNLRYQMLQWYEHNIDASVAGSIDKMIQKFTVSGIPAPLVQMMREHLAKINDVYRDNFDSRLHDWQARYPAHTFPKTGAYIPPTSTGAASDGSPAGAPPLSQFNFGGGFGTLPVR